MYEAKVKIGLKKGVSDPEGANTLKALHLLGFNTVKEAKTTRTVDLLIDGKSKDDVKNKVRAEPTEEELLNELPTIVWP